MAYMKKHIPDYRSNPNKLTRAQKEHLIYGYIMLDSKEGDFPFKDEEERKTLFFRYKEHLFSMQGQKKDFGHPAFNWGARPAAWWDYEMKMSKWDIPQVSLSMVYMGYGRAEVEHQDQGRNIFMFLKSEGLLFEGEEDKMREQMKQEKEEREGLHSKAQTD